MKKYISINGKEFLIREIDQLSIKDYQELMRVMRTDNEILLMKSAIRLLTDITWEIDYVQLINLYEIDWESILKTNLDDKSRLKTKYIFDNKKYYLPRFEELRFENWIDVDDIIKNTPENISMIVAILISKDYDLDSITNLANIIESEMTIRESYIIFNRFIEWRNIIFKKYEGLFKNINKDELSDKQKEDWEKYEKEQVENTENTENEWLTIAYSLTGDDITKKDEILKRGIVEILNWLTYLKNKREEEEKAYERLNKNH